MGNCVCATGEVEETAQTSPYGGNAPRATQQHRNHNHNHHRSKHHRDRGAGGGYMLNEPSYLVPQGAQPPQNNNPTNPQVRSDAELAYMMNLEEQRRARGWRHRQARKQTQGASQINNRIEERMLQDRLEQEKERKAHASYEAELLELQRNAKRLEEEKKAKDCREKEGTSTHSAHDEAAAEEAAEDSGSTCYSIPDPDAAVPAESPFTPRSDAGADFAAAELAEAKRGEEVSRGAEEGGEEEEDPECAVCLDNLNAAPSTFLPCMHGFHHICIKQVCRECCVFGLCFRWLPKVWPGRWEK